MLLVHCRSTIRSTARRSLSNTGATFCDMPARSRPALNAISIDRSLCRSARFSGTGNAGSPCAEGSALIVGANSGLKTSQQIEITAAAESGSRSTPLPSQNENSKQSQLSRLRRKCRGCYSPDHGAGAATSTGGTLFDLTLPGLPRRRGRDKTAH